MVVNEDRQWNTANDDWYNSPLILSPLALMAHPFVPLSGSFGANNPFHQTVLLLPIIGKFAFAYYGKVKC